MVLRMLMRSLFLQSAWNYERMQNLGFVYAIAPVLKELYTDKEERRRALMRHLELFNTHPILAAPIIGASAHLERGIRDGRVRPEAVHSLKLGLMGSYGAIGDSFFWASFRPLSALLGVTLFLEGLTLAPIIFLIFYNLVHLWFRGLGLMRGYEEGPEVVEVIRGWDFPKLTRRVRIVIIFIAAFSLSLVLREVVQRGAPIPLLWGGGLLASVLIFHWLLKKGLSPGTIIAGASVILFIAGFLMR